MAPVRLVPLPPTPGAPVPVDRTPFWIGSGRTASLAIGSRGVADRHACLTAASDGLYLAGYPGVAPPRVDGRAITQPTRLADGQVIELAPDARWEIVTGAVRVAPPRPISGPERSPPGTEPRPVVPPSPRPRGFPAWAALLLLLVGALVVGAGYVGWRAWIRSRAADRAVTDSFTYLETQLYDSLMVESSRAIERGSTLLDLGLPDAAAAEFAGAIAVFERSLLADNKFVRPTVDALAATVQEIYRFNRLNAPAAFARGRGLRANLSLNLAARLTPEQFAAGVERVTGVFRRRWGRGVDITGADHPEHLSLYGPGGALDIRVRDLSRDQVDFLIRAFVAVGIRVKDFSRDVILQRQIQAAIAAGLADRAGTGLHLHIDRFRDRRDAFTVPSR
jgi:hypothetical protein